DEVDVTPPPRPSVRLVRRSGGGSPGRHFPEGGLFDADQPRVAADNRLQPVFVGAVMGAFLAGRDALLDELDRGVAGRHLRSEGAFVAVTGRLSRLGGVDVGPDLGPGAAAPHGQDLLAHVLPRPLALPVTGVEAGVFRGPLRQTDDL